MQPTSRGNPRGTKKKTCGTRRTRRTRGSHPEAHPKAIHANPLERIVLMCNAHLCTFRVRGSCLRPHLRPALLLPGRWRWWRTSVRRRLGWWEYWCWWVPRRWWWLQHSLRRRIRGWRRIIRGPVPVRVGPIREAPGARRHFRIRLHRLVLVPRLILVSRLIRIPMLPRIPILLPGCLQNMQSAQKR